jgi:hypothetical protein
MAQARRDINPSAAQLETWKSWIGKRVTTPIGTAEVLSVGPSGQRLRVKLGNDTIKLIVPTEATLSEHAAKATPRPKASKRAAAKSEPAGVA